MTRVFITGSSDGLGLMAARLLLEEGRVNALGGVDAVIYNAGVGPYERRRIETACEGGSAGARTRPSLRPLAA